VISLPDGSRHSVGSFNELLLPFLLAAFTRAIGLVLLSPLITMLFPPPVFLCSLPVSEAIRTVTEFLCFPSFKKILFAFGISADCHPLLEAAYREGEGNSKYPIVGNYSK
jgi:hypothetical protein